MRNRCEAFEEAIWDHVRFGTDLPADARAHINHCSDCARDLNEAGRLAGVVVTSDCVPPAPDCRDAVMARIAPRQRQPRLTWAYACAAVAIASIAISGIMSLGPSNKPVARNVANAPVMAKVQPKLIPPAPRRDLRAYSNTGERYNPPGVKPGKPKKIEPIMVASAVTKPIGVEADIPMPETRTEIAWDSNVMDAKDAVLPATEAAPAADETRPAPASAPAMSGYSNLDSIALKSDLDTRTQYFATANSKPATGSREDSSRARVSGSRKLASEFEAKTMDSFAFKKEKADTVDGGAKLAVGFSNYTLSNGPSPALADKFKSAVVLEGSAVETKLILADAAAPADDDARPVAIVIASWTPPEPRPVNYGYDYTDIDTVTGRTTTVSVKRSGNHVEVRLEGSKPPVKGSVDHATIPNV